MTTYTVRIPIMCYANVTIKMEDDAERDDIIEKALNDFETHTYHHSYDNTSVGVTGLNGAKATLDCEYFWDDFELITIKTHDEEHDEEHDETNKETD